MDFGVFFFGGGAGFSMLMCVVVVVVGVCNYPTRLLQRGVLGDWRFCQVIRWSSLAAI
jgi:hypothetical protein